MDNEPKREPTRSKLCPTCGGPLLAHDQWLREVHLEMAKKYKETLAHLNKLRKLQRRAR